MTSTQTTKPSFGLQSRKRTSLAATKTSISAPLQSRKRKPSASALFACSIAMTVPAADVPTLLTWFVLNVHAIGKLTICALSARRSHLQRSTRNFFNGHHWAGPGRLTLGWSQLMKIHTLSLMPIDSTILQQESELMLIHRLFWVNKLKYISLKLLIFQRFEVKD